MTKVMIEGSGWVYLQVVLDWYTKKIVGYSLSKVSKTSDWLEALNNAINEQFPEGIRETIQMPLRLISDNGCQPTSERFMKACSQLNIEQIFTSYNNPKGNADTERVIRTMKEDMVWLSEWEKVSVFEEELKRWIERYNNDYPHSSLGYKTPVQFEQEYVLFSTKISA